MCVGHILDLVGAEAREGLVEEQQLRPGGEGHRQLHLLLVPVGQVADLLVARPVEVKEPQQLERALVGHSIIDRGAPREHDVERTPPPVRVRAEHDIVEGGERGEQRGDLEGTGQSEPDDGVGGATGDRRTLEDDTATARCNDTGDEIEHGGLAGAVRADQAEQLAAVDIEPEVGNGGQPPEAPAQVVDLEENRHRIEARPARSETSPPGRNSMTLVSRMP